MNLGLGIKSTDFFSLIVSIYTQCFRGLLTDELEQMFRDAPLAPNVRAHDRIREAYARATGKVVEQSSDNDSKKRMPAEDDDCPICYDGMHGVPESTLVFCEECRNALHKECFAECRSLLWSFPTPTKIMVM